MRRRGFTFIEIMLVTAIFATIAGAVFTCLSNGIRLWDRGRQLMAQEDVLVFFDRFAADLRNTFAYSKIPFSGEAYALEFPTMVWTPADRVSVRAPEGVVDQIGKVRYAYDPGRGTVVRAQANYAQALGEAWGPDEVIVPAAGALRFHYFYAGSRDPHMSADASDGLPSGVEVELVIPGRRGEKVFRRYIAVPEGV